MCPPVLAVAALSRKKASSEVIVIDEKRSDGHRAAKRKDGPAKAKAATSHVLQGLQMALATWRAPESRTKGLGETLHQSDGYTHCPQGFFYLSWQILIGDHVMDRSGRHDA